MSARLTPAPLSQWVQLGRRVITARWADGGWKVVADETGRKGVKVQQVGLSLFPEPAVLSGKHASVVSEEVEADEDAREILADADDFIPSLAHAYGEGAAAQHPVIFLVRDVKQGEQLSGVKNFRKEVPQGFVLNATAYIEWPQWGTSTTLERDSVIAHELTHVASWEFLGRSPHSMFEGLAMYHQDRFVRQFGYLYPLRNVTAAYRSGQFPSIVVWQRRMTDWGLKSPAAVDLCYEDAQAMVAAILTHHGGAAGLGRLAQAFTAYHLKGFVYSQQQVRDAFQHGLGVSFDQVVAEAHAYAAAHAG